MTDLHGKTFVVTGANTGLGRASVEALAAEGAGHVVLAARSRNKTEPVIEAVRAQYPDTELSYVAIDLGDLGSVSKAADTLLERDAPIDVLMANAGVAGLRGLTKDGFELTFGVNHLGHFLLTEKLLPLVERAPQGRIVNVSSRGHYQADGIDWDALRRPTATFTALPEYAVSKLCNVLYAKELARRLRDTAVTTYSLHPGGVASDIWQRRLGPLAVLLKPFLITNEQGARTQVRCAIDPAVSGESGLYYTDEEPRDPLPLACDEGLQDELVDRSRGWTSDWL